MFFILISQYPILYQFKHFIFNQYLPVSDSFDTTDISLPFKQPKFTGRFVFHIPK